ncbi:caspase family protein [Mesorhizobium sp. ES1-6]|uniref:caspase family protein n=1 Tax=Mesorhizobium sp. ES1-6 TaxID=2876626 RepID=UPI001CCC79DB|nr:caspase family protein [Mesorhizobium sp. ES1-6]MBZ9801090.1 hypothetical protein [Mesorhizobium sp. ES1-6]
MTAKTLSTDPEDHAAGVVFHDPADGPHTHVLILGVGSYPWSDFAELTSPPASARAVADWFLGFGQTEFINPQRPLGSVAVLLSEPVTGGKAKADRSSARIGASYRGIETLRPNYANARIATEAWRNRLKANSQNMAVVYLCGHGLSENGVTAFVLEDHGFDKDKPFSSLVDLNDLTKAAASLAVPAQLLFFDCCRSDASLGLQSGLVGDRLLDHAGPRRADVGQVAQYATLLAKEAGGRTGQTSLFAASLINALDLAGSKETGRWVVRAGRFRDVLGDCLALYGRSIDEIQDLDGAISGKRIDLNFPRYSDEVRTFVSLADPERWNKARITLTRVDSEGKKTEFRTIEAAGLAEPFYDCPLPAGALFGFSAAIDTEELAVEPFEIEAPAIFVRLGDGFGSTVSVVDTPVQPDGRNVSLQRWEPSTTFSKSLAGKDDSREPHGAVRIDIEIHAPMFAQGAVATIDPLGEMSPPASENLVIALGGRSSAILPMPGRYRVTLALPDGRRTERIVTSKWGERQKIVFDIGNSPREFLYPAFLAGIVRPKGTQGGLGIKAADGPLTIRAVRPPSFSSRKLDQVSEKARPKIHVRQDELGQIRYGLVEFEDPLAPRFRREPASLIGAPLDHAGGSPLWVEVRVGGLTEVCVVPSLGGIAKYGGRNWRAQVVIDRAPGRDRLHMSSVVDSPEWSGLLAFLGRRDFDRASQVLQHMRQSPFGEFLGDAHNPFLQIGAALIFAATGPVTHHPLDMAVEKLAVDYPSLPDGPIILARRRWARAQSAGDRTDALALFREGFRRGVPMFTLALDWLGQGLSESEDCEGAAAAAAAKELAWRVDLTRCFTCFRLDTQGEA